MLSFLITRVSKLTPTLLGLKGKFHEKVVPCDSKTDMGLCNVFSKAQILNGQCHEIFDHFFAVSTGKNGFAKIFDRKVRKSRVCVVKDT